MCLLSVCVPKTQRNPVELHLLPHSLHSCIAVRIWLVVIVLVQEPVLFVKQNSQTFLLAAQQCEQAGAKPSMSFIASHGVTCKAF